MATKKNEMKKIIIRNFGIVGGLKFERDCGYGEVYADRSEQKRFIDAIRKFVEEKCPDDLEFILALDCVNKKIAKHCQSLRIVEQVIIGTGNVKFDHLAEKFD